MSDTRNAIALRSHTNGDTSYLEGALILNMPAAQFDDLEAIGLVRSANDEEAAAAPLATMPQPATEPAPE